ncbi:MAG: His/Gly/Thr/Pro-type tRNA ligase C-terminal domain-containing protein, partial [Halobacteria archaeon]|nr:His/Gly/Thr/Pro-type tRNA ligase C-terminal domain-containing protein [Halobacteria archaeon]
KQVETALSLYEEFYDFLGIPYVITERPEWDKFPGADYTYAVDTLMPDGKALQIGTAHNLGQNFSEAFDVDFETPDGEHDHVYQTSYGVSERCIAALMSVHGDDNGLVLPSDVAPTQIAIVPILFGDDDENAEILEKCEEIEDELENAGLRVELDDTDDSPGAKYYKWELKGTPLRIEVGPRDMEDESAVLVNRLGDESDADFDSIVERVEEELAELTEEIRDEAQKGFDENTVECADYEEAREVAGNGFARVEWCGDEDCGKTIEDELGVDMLGEPRDSADNRPEAEGDCLECDDKAERVVLLAKTY